LSHIDHLFKGSGERHGPIRIAVEDAAARSSVPSITAVSSRVQQAACEPALVHHEGQVDEKTGTRHFGPAAGKGCDARAPLDHERVAPLATVRRYADAEIVAAVEAGLGAAAEAALIDLRAHGGLRALVETAHRLGDGTTVGRNRRAVGLH